MLSHVNVVSTAMRPLRPIHRAHSQLVNNVPNPQPTDSTAGWIFRPLTLCQTNSPGTPWLVATTGLRAAQPSSTTMPNGSLRLGTQTASQALNSSACCWLLGMPSQG